MQTKLSKQQKEILLLMDEKHIRYTDTLIWAYVKKHSKLEHEDNYEDIYGKNDSKKYSCYFESKGEWFYPRKKEERKFIYPRVKASFSRSIKRLLERELIFTQPYDRQIILTEKGRKIIEELKNNGC